MNRNKLGKGIDDCDEQVLNKATEEYIKAIYVKDSLAEQHISDNTDSSTLKINDVDASEFFEKKHQHYFKDVSNLEYVDIYRVLKLWEVSDPCLQHAAKKILVAGNRGHKDIQKDVQEAIDSLLRWQEIYKEDNKENL